MAPVSKEDLAVVAESMAVDMVTAEVVGRLLSEGMAPILLKGPSIGRWLYPSEGRPYRDTDLLVASECFAEASRVLRQLGFGNPSRGFAAHAHTYRRIDAQRGAAFAVDLHRTLPYVTVRPSAAWHVLSEQTETISIQGVDVPVLARPAQCFHISLHAVQHVFESGRPLEDLRRALAATDVATWQAAAEVSRRLGAEDAFAAGLDLEPQGRALAAQLGLTERRRGLLRFLSDPDTNLGAYQVQRIFDSPSPSMAVKLVIDNFFPSPSVLRTKSRLARRGRAGLAASYAIRPFVLASRLPIAVAARRHIVSLNEQESGGPEG